MPAPSLLQDTNPRESKPHTNKLLSSSVQDYNHLPTLKPAHSPSALLQLVPAPLSPAAISHHVPPAPLLSYHPEVQLVWLSPPTPPLVYTLIRPLMCISTDSPTLTLWVIIQCYLIDQTLLALVCENLSAAPWDSWHTPVTVLVWFGLVWLGHVPTVWRCKMPRLTVYIPCSRPKICQPHGPWQW